jgi:hypothetical protein
MSTELDFALVINELKRHHRSALSFYNKKNLGSRLRKPPSPTSSDAVFNRAWQDFEIQQYVEPQFRKRWLRRLDKTAQKVNELDKDEYRKIEQIFKQSDLEERGFSRTQANFLEEEIRNLGRVIDYLSKKHLSSRDNKFSFDRKRLLLKKGSEVIENYSVGLKKHSRACGLLAELFSSRTKKVCQYPLEAESLAVKRANDKAMYKVNKKAGCELVKKKVSRYGKRWDYYLDPTLI